MKSENLTLEREITRDCPILFRMRNRPMTETCMCWGFECGEGWMDTLSDACRRMEVLNQTFYPRYRVRIQADQIKEKYGTLHFYHSIVVDPNPFLTLLGGIFERVNDYLSDWNRFDYKTTRVVDEDPFDYDDVREIDRETYESRISSDHKPSNVEWTEKDGKYLEICHLRNYGRSHIEPTRLKFLWKLKDLSAWLGSMILNRFPRKDSSAVRNVVSFLDGEAISIIRKAEQECYERCEDCGTQIGKEWSPRCETKGWIRYLCEECAEKTGKQYLKDGKSFCGCEEVSDGVNNTDVSDKEKQ